MATVGHISEISIYTELEAMFDAMNAAKTLQKYYQARFSYATMLCPEILDALCYQGCIDYTERAELFSLVHRAMISDKFADWIKELFEHPDNFVPVLRWYYGH